MSMAPYKSKKGESSSQYRQCVPPCPRLITSGDAHILCVVCLGAKHAESALEGAGCPHCERLPLRSLRSRKTLFDEGVFASAPHGAGGGGAAAAFVGLAIGFGRGNGDGRGILYPHLPDPLPVLWDRKPVLRFLPLRVRAQRFTYLPLRRKMWRVLIIRPFNPHNTRS